MSKIYSRPRIRIPKISFSAHGNGKGRKKQKKLKIFIIITIAIATIKIVLDAVLPIFDNLCDNKAKSIATIVTNEQSTVVMEKHPYEDFFTIEKDNNGNVTMIKSNVGFINSVISDITVNIQNEIDNKGKDDVKIALGSFTGIALLSGRGPSVKIVISTIGNVETNLKSEFIAKGINQTLHRVYLELKCEVSILTPFKNITTDITNQVLIAENVIVGNIPSTYYELEGLNKEDSMEVIE